MNRIVAFLLVVMVSAGCATKDEKARTNIAKTWRISKVFQNANDVTASYTSTRIDFRINFTSNGGFTESYYPFSGASQITNSGTWFFSDGVNKISLEDNNQSRIYQVDLLDEDNFNITDLGSSNDLMIEFIPD